jgi:hypothetical protein
MHCVGVAVGAEFLQLQPCCGVTTVFHRRIARYAWRSLADIGATLGALQGNNDTNALSHESLSISWLDTITYYLIT